MEKRLDADLSELKGRLRIGPLTIDFRRDKSPTDLEAENLRLRARIEELEARLREHDGSR